MDLSDPTRAIAATLDGAVLATLAASGRPLTVGQVASQAARGSEIGVRRSLARLVEQGIVRATVMGRNQVHELNREHVAAPIATLLAGLRGELWSRMRGALQAWDPQPVYASVFGSAARADGDAASDIDLLLVHPPFPGETAPVQTPPSLLGTLTDAIELHSQSRVGAEAVIAWERQIDALRVAVESWTGNPLQVVDLSFFEWRRPSPHHRPLLADIRRDGIDLVTQRPLATKPVQGRVDAER
jgi:predicted nucleotidyltransferase/DNA-binding transcriptional ArsR family regulator